VEKNAPPQVAKYIEDILTAGPDAAVMNATPATYDTKLTLPIVRCNHGFSLSIPHNIKAIMERPAIPAPMPMARLVRQHVEKSSTAQM